MRVGGPLSGSGSVAAEMRAANRLIESIQENTVLSRRDRAIIGVIGYAWVPIHGIAGMKVRDYYQLGESRWVRWTDHGTEHRDLLVPRLVRLLDEYVEAAGIADDSWG